MKNLFTRLMLVAVAALSIVACQTEPEITTVPEKNTFTLTVTAEQETTRTYLGEADENGVYQAQWNNEGEVIRIFEYVNNSDTTSVASTGFEKLIDGTAKFTAELTKIDEATVIEDIDYYAIYPESNRIKSDNVDITAFKFNIPTEQTPTATSFDGNADFMIAKPVVNQTEQLTELSMSFKRLVSIGKMTLTNLDTESTIESVDLTFSLAEGAVAGYSRVDLTTSQYISCYQNYKTLKLSYNEPISKDAPIYFVSLPVCISAGDSFEIVVRTTDGCIFTRTVELAEGKEIKLTEGNMTGFKVNMSTADKQVPSTDVFTLLTDVNELNAGDKIIIAAAEYDVALSTTQNSNNRGQASITKNEDDTISYGADVQILTVEAGNKAGTFAFNTGSGYLYAASSSSNYLRTETTLSDNSSWTISVDSSSVATIKAQGANTRNWLRYNDASSMFSCYSSGQADVAIYYLDGEEPDYLTVSPKVIEFESIGGNKTFTVDTNIDDTVQIEHGSKFQISDPVDGVYTVTATENTTTEVIEDIITIKVGTLEDTINVSQKAATVSVEDEVVDVLNRALTGVTGTSYTEWSGKTVTSAAVYAGQSAGGNESIQLRSSNSNSGIVTTKSGGKAKKISVTWNSNTSSGRTLNIYGKNTAYSAATDLYNTSNQGTLLGTIVYGTSTELVIEGDYEYIGLRSNSGAMYLTEIQITWSASDDATGGETGDDNTGGDNTGDVGDVNTTTVVKSEGLQASTTASYMDDVISYVNSAGNNYSDPIRIYKNNVFTISAAEGHYITEVVFETPSSDYATALLNGTFAVDGGASVNVSNDGLIVTFKITGNSSQLKITASSAQFRASSISVTYTN